MVIKTERVFFILIVQCSLGVSKRHLTSDGGSGVDDADDDDD